MSAREVVNFKAQKGPQESLITCPIQDILYGGARGGGKSYGILGHFLAKAAAAYEKHQQLKCFNGLLVRKTYPELLDMLKKAEIIFDGIATFKKSEKLYIFKDEVYGRATLRFGYLDKDPEIYQGHEYTWFGVEEAGNFAVPDALDKISATLRSAIGVKCYQVMTANPGGPGHNWLKGRYIDTAPPYTPFETIHRLGRKDYKTKRVYIPAKVTDNKILLDNDPNYIANILKSASGNKGLERAWLYGDWNIVAGGMFDDVWDLDVHVLKPFTLPPSWPIYRAFDWGSTKPFSVGWWAKTDGGIVETAKGIVKFPAGSYIRIHEWYGSSGKPNEGLKMIDREIAKKIREIETHFRWNVSAGPSDWNIWDESQGHCLARDYEKEQVYFKPADKGKRVVGWQKMREYLFNAKQRPMELPAMFVFDSCRDFIRTVPVLERSKTIPDDVDTNGEDHIADETRYMLTFKPISLELGKLTGY